MNSNNSPIRNFYIYNKNGTKRDDIEKAWLEARTITKDDLKFGSVLSIMNNSVFVAHYTHKVLNKLQDSISIPVIISFQILKSGHKFAFLRLIDQEKLDKYNSKI